MLVLISAKRGSLKLSESRLAMDTVRGYASPDAHVIYGTAHDESLGDQVRVTVVATGLNRQAPRRQAPPLQVMRTGTDNVPFTIPTLTDAVAQTNNLGGSPTPRIADMDFSNVGRPQVWANAGRRGASAAARVDAMSSGGMDDIDIPAFLRKQAD